MTNGPFTDPSVDAAWRAYAERDTRREAPADLGHRVLAAVRAEAAGGRHGATGPRRRTPSVVAWAGLAASIAVALWLPSPVERTAVLDSEAFAWSGIPAAVAPDRPVPAAAPVPPRERAVPGEVELPPLELPSVLMTFNAGPLQDREPLQMVRLRLPREALQALGLALLEPDAAGVIDVDVLIGEDGLPRDIRKVRIEQEQKQ